MRQMKGRRDRKGENGGMRNQQTKRGRQRMVPWDMAINYSCESMAGLLQTGGGI